jgi:hypothetical protein
MAIRRAVLIGAAGIAAITLIGACSGGSSRATGVGAKSNAATASRDAAPPGVARSGGGSVADTSPGTTVAVVTTAKIRQVAMTVEVAKAADVARRADQAGAIAASAGGEVYGDDREGGKDATATLTLKVPPAALSDVVRDLSRLGTEKSRTSSTKDVTAEVVDVDTRVASLQDAITELQKLYNRPDQPLADVLEVERELAARESDLESLQAQQRALHAQTDTATVTLTLVTAAPPVHKKHHAGGFVGGLRDGWDAFVHGATAVATGVGAVVPFAVLLLLLAFGLRLVWPRLGARRRVPVVGGE